MDGNILTNTAERAGSRYKLFLTALVSVYHQYSQSARPGSPSNKKKALNDAYRLAGEFLVEEKNAIEDAVLGVAREAYSATAEDAGDLPTIIMEHALALSQELEHTIRTQLERDIAEVTKSLSSLNLKSNLISLGKGVTFAAALSMLRNEEMPGRGFNYQDRIGRFIPSYKFIKTIWRKTLLMAWNETALFAMAMNGVTKAIISHPDESHKEYGTVIDILESPEYVTWGQVKDDVFHPNSNAYLTPLV